MPPASATASFHTLPSRLPARSRPTPAPANPFQFSRVPAPTVSFHLSVPQAQPFLPLRADPALRGLGARPSRPTVRSPARPPGAASGPRSAGALRCGAGRGRRRERGAEGGAGSGFSRSLRAEAAPSQRRPAAERSAGPQPHRGGRGTGGAAERSGRWSGRRYRNDRGAGAGGRLRDVVAGPDAAGCERRRHGTRSVSPSAGDRL
ncbi:translation initiation factor IF-2 [Sylvia atricapilla]|uniref:translation initiation factor IF-2 n=1 Tax=Sylvia atricapilla TaxID=48155 RepID=UPI003397792F